MPLFNKKLNQFIDDSLVVLGNIHHPSLCEGRHCVIHNPSDHSMISFPLIWRCDKRVFERICQHGVGHPDPDDIQFHIAQGNAHLSIHGCDGCCRSHNNKESQ